MAVLVDKKKLRRAFRQHKKSFLEKLDYSDIHTTDNGFTAVAEFKKLVKESTPPIVLLDYMLPDMDCRSVLTQMLDIQPSARVVLETATEKEDEGIKELIRLGVYQYLEKPIRFESLKEVFETIEKENFFFQKEAEQLDRKSTRLNSSHSQQSRMPSSA